MAKQLPKKDEVVIRSYNMADIRAVDDGNYIEGHPAIYSQVTNIGNWFYEVIERGAFDNCNFDDVLFCINHNEEMIPLARSRRNNVKSTMQLNVDDAGIAIKASLDIDNNNDASSLYSSVKRGDIDGMSFIFYVEEERWEGLDTDMPTRHILKIKKVREVSAVNHPAYTGTDINITSARSQAELDNAAKALENARAELDNSKNKVELEVLKLKTQILAKG